MSHDGRHTETEAASAGEGSGGRADWAWATEHRAPESASTAQLVSWLARGELPPHTLVWKPGWGEWLPALQVAELASAFPRLTPGSRRVARALLEGETTPPPVPVADYPRLRLLAKDVLSVGEAEVTPFTALPHHTPAQAGRRALRDPDHAQHELVTSQVPAAAMLERARSMKLPGTAGAPSSAERWGHYGTFGDTAPASSPRAPAVRYAPQQAAPQQSAPQQSAPQQSAPRPAAPTPAAPALDAEVPAAPEPSERPPRASSGYGAWLLGGALVGSVLGVVSLRVGPPPAAAPPAIAALTPAPPPAPEPAPPPPPPPAVEVAARAPAAKDSPKPGPPAVKKPGVTLVKRAGETAVLHALRSVEKEGFDRVVFEFRERMPGYRIGYVEKPVRDCGSGDARRIEGNARLEVRFSPAAAHTEQGEPTVRERELKPASSMVREIERTCDFEGVLTWVVGTEAQRHYRAFELKAPPRLVVDIDR